MSRDRASAPPKPEWVYEVPEGTAIASYQPAGQHSRVFFEGRFKSIAICDEQAFLPKSVYIKINPMAAKIAATRETTSASSSRQSL
jgi:hypothetical protein